MRLFYILFLAISFTACQQSSCADFDLKGHWQVESVELDDPDGMMKELVEENQGNYESYLESIKQFEDIEYYFKDSNIVYIVNPEEVGESGEEIYDYKNGSNNIVLGGRVFDFSVQDCESITITDVAMQGTANFIMICKKLD